MQAQPLFPQLLAKALQLVRGCNCRSTSGCPACIQSMSCDEYNAVLHKDAAIAILEITLAAEAEYAERAQKEVRRRGSPCSRCLCFTDTLWRIALKCAAPYILLQRITVWKLQHGFAAQSLSDSCAADGGDAD